MLNKKTKKSNNNNNNNLQTGGCVGVGVCACECVCGCVCMYLYMWVCVGVCMLIKWNEIMYKMSKCIYLKEIMLRKEAVDLYAGECNESK